MELKDNLKILRKRAGFSQEQLAAALNLSHQSVSKWETGAAFPSADHLFKLCEILNCKLSDLVGGENPRAADEPDLFNKSWFVAALSENLGLRKFDCHKINKIFEETFLLGRRDKNKILSRLETKLGYSPAAADRIYSAASSILLAALKYRLLHPFVSPDEML